jgi:hypothetical protein
VLEYLELQANGLRDNNIISLTNALVGNGRLRELGLFNNVGVTAATSEASSAILQNPTSGLEKINMDIIRINDSVLVSFANALANNNKLRELSICECATEGFYHTATDSGWEAISNLL